MTVEVGRMEREAVDNLGVALGMEVEGGSDKGEGGRGGWRGGWNCKPQGYLLKNRIRYGRCSLMYVISLTS